MEPGAGRRPANIHQGSFVKSNRYFGLVMAAIAALALSGCVSLPEQQAFNREAHADIKTIKVLQANPVDVHVFMLNNPGYSFGLIGGLVAAADQAGKESSYRAIMAKAGFDPTAYFKDQLTARMADRGYTLQWSQPAFAEARVDRGAYGLRKAYPAATDVDAQLDVNLVVVAYAAAGAGASSPYRPTITAGVRLVSPDGKQNLYTDFFVYNNVFNAPKAVVLNADPVKYSYPTFSALQAADTSSIDGLKAALDEVANKIASQL